MLSSKESELEEIKNKLAEKVREELKEELQKIKDLESKMVELKKIVESLTSEVLYLKGELRKSEPKEVKIDKIERFEKVKEETEKVASEKEGEDDIIVCD